jgi:ketosteroid isomerase-like protein
MSQENVEIVRRSLEAFKRDGVEAMLPVFGEDVVCEESPRWPDRKTYHGHDGVRQAWEKVCDAFDRCVPGARGLHRCRRPRRRVHPCRRTHPKERSADRCSDRLPVRDARVVREAMRRKQD